MPIEFKIHSLTPANYDEAALGPLLRHSLGESFNMVKRLIDEWADGTCRYTSTGEALFTAQFEGKTLGVGGRSLDPYVDNPRVARVRRLYVLPEWRHIGIGASLLENIIDVPAGLFDKMTVRTMNPVARKFYERHGFSYIGEGETTHELQL